jgi:hypothetical protein
MAVATAQAVSLLSAILSHQGRLAAVHIHEYSYYKNNLDNETY